MRARSPRARGFSTLALVVAALLLPPTFSADSTRVVFTHPPTDMFNVGSIVPLGSLNPGGGHVLPVDHMYINYQAVPGAADRAFRVDAMANGSIVMVTREQEEGRPHPDYGIYVRHSRAITSYVLHVHVPSAALATHLALAPEDSWIAVRPSFRVLLLGQRGAPPPLAVAGGEELGLTINYSHAWDVGVIDTHVTGDFIGRGERRYPTLMDYMSLLGVAADPPFEGQQTLNAACFLSYMTPEMREEWTTKLISLPQTCGQAGWDVRGRLRGAWFSDAVDAAPDPPLFNLSSGALSVIPDVEIPSMFVRVAIGAGPLSPIDPTRTLEQLQLAFKVAIDRTAGTRVNPDPSLVRVRAGSVCYDLEYGTSAGTRYNTVLFNLMASWRLRVRYDATPHPTPQCGVIPLPEPDDTWAEYRR